MSGAWRNLEAGYEHDRLLLLPGALPTDCQLSPMDTYPRQDRPAGNREAESMKKLRRRFALWRLRRIENALHTHVEEGHCLQCDMGVECQAVAAMEGKRDAWQAEQERLRYEGE
jgi:hypothetical protein